MSYLCVQVAGASIQISGDMLPNSTERLVTVSGSVDAVTRGILQICNVMLEVRTRCVSITLALTTYSPGTAAGCT